MGPELWMPAFPVVTAFRPEIHLYMFDRSLDSFQITYNFLI